MKRNGKIKIILSLLVVFVMSMSFIRPLEAHEVTEEDFTDNHTSVEAVLYDNTNGLPTSEANAITQTSEGFIWIGGYSGLVRYDGNSFYLYPSSLGIASVLTLYVDSRDRLLIGTNENGVSILDNNTFIHVTREDGLRSSSIRNFVEDSEGNILLGMGQGLDYLDKDNNLHQILDSRTDTKTITRLEKTDSGMIWGLTGDGDVFTVENLKVKEFYSVSSIGLGTIFSIRPDDINEGYVYLGLEDNRVVYADLKNMEEAITYETGEQSKINSIHIINKDIWLCANNGIGFIKDGVYHEYKDVPLNNCIDHMMVDMEGNLWFTSSRQGVMKLVENRFTDISAMADLDALVVNSTHIYDNDLYIACETGLVVLDKNSYEIKENAVSELLKTDRIRSIYEDSKGQLWFNSNGDNGLVCYDPKSDEYVKYTVDDGLASNKPRLCIELRDGSMAVATNNGLNIIKDGVITKTYDEKDGISNVKLLSLIEGENGEIITGSDGDGIYIIENGSVSKVSLDEGLASEVIMRIKKDPIDSSLYWIVTSNSLAYMKDRQVTTITKFPYSNNFDLYFSKNNEMWVLSGNGIYVVDREAMLKNEEIRYSFYDASCGLPYITTANSYSYLAKDGTLYISGTSGVASMNINDDSTDKTKLKICIPYVYCDDTYIGTLNSDTVTIPADCQRLTIGAFAFTYSLSNPYLSYQLEGFDKDAKIITRKELGDISYTNLDGGTYKFRMSQIDNVTGQVYREFVLTIIKEKAIYEQPWFWVLMVLLGIGIVAGSLVIYYRRKTKLLEKKAEENRKMISEMCDVFAKCIDMKDRYTNGHSSRVAKYTCMIAERMGKTKEELEDIHNIALLHDIGKISIPDNILNKPGKLDDNEFVVMKNHAKRGFEILKEVSIAPDLAIGAGYHHERLDGKGYPFGLKKEEIPEIAQIIAVADMFDAMYSTRPYRKGMELSRIAEEMEKVKGTQLNEEVVNIMEELIKEGKFDNEWPENKPENKEEKSE
ncbi:MAG: HD domain-containing protein [Erysipelotrichaceae bacterium]|nr:HD domain-containing protein [Erysipelotrichaceae bacterium]